MPKLTADTADALVRRMREQAIVPLDLGAQVTDEEYEAVREALGPAIADIIEKHIGVEGY